MNFDFSHLINPPLPKFIVLQGPGLGKSTIIRLIEKEYWEQNIPYLITSDLKEAKKLKNFLGIIFIELNSFVFFTNKTPPDTDFPCKPYMVINFPTSEVNETLVKILKDIPPINTYQEKDNK